MIHCSAMGKVRTKLFFTENIYYVSAFVNVRIAQEPALKFQSSDKASRSSFYNLNAAGCDHQPFNSYVSK